MSKRPNVAILKVAARSCTLLLLAVLLLLPLGSCIVIPKQAPDNANNNANDNNNNNNNNNNDNNNNNANNNSGDSSNYQPKVLSEGDQAPDFSFTTTTGVSGKLSDYQGKVVFVNFWASWCGYCVQEMPDINKVRQQYPDVVILAINVNDTQSDAMGFINKTGYDLNWVLDDGTISRLYPADGIPYTLIVKPDGTISTIFPGGTTFSNFEKAVTAAGATK